MGEATMRIKRLIRPFIPDRLMARYRLHAHSQQSRVNVDVVLPLGVSERRWLGATPDTYRVIRGSVPVTETGPTATISMGPNGDLATGLHARVDCDVAVVGTTSEPRLIARRRTEPIVEPSGIAMTPEVLASIGGEVDGQGGLGAVLSMVRVAGWRIALEPTALDPSLSGLRTDPIDRPPVVVLAGVPMHDIGGGSRGAQLSAEYVAAGCHVLHVALFGTQESIDLGLRFVSRHLEHEQWDTFDAPSVLRRVSNAGLCIVDLPAPQFREPVESLKRAGWTIVYDVIDDWSDPALGGEWWDARTESWFASHADVVTASAPDLVARMEELGVAATLVPNAVNTSMFSPAGPIADDMPNDGSLILGYHGSLYGDWFDWEALASVAMAFSEAVIVVIGDDKAPHPSMPANVRFLGLRAQVDLPSYVRAFDVGLLPFVTSDTTHAVSPLKVYEYLACGVPVAAPPLRALDGLPSVSMAEDLVDAVHRSIESPPVDTAAFGVSESWLARIATISDATGVPLPDAPGDRVRVEVRPVLHYRRNERVVEASAGRLPDRDDPS